jgi:quinolinate synthase
VQEIADVVGDSFALSKYCATAAQSVIVFCGVHFMAESAKILSPRKTVLLPELTAGCPMADMVTAADVQELKRRHPRAAAVSYINTSAAVKAECDICCTSSNAVKVIQSLNEEEIIFVPDKNLGDYIARQVPEKKMIIWDGFCVTHHRVTAEEVTRVREAHPDALVLVHPECRPEVVALADFVGSTKQIIDFATASPQKKFIIGTEMGILYRLKKDNPGKTFYLLSPGLICPNMKKTTLKSVYNALTRMQYPIEVAEEIIIKARSALERMLRVS